MEYNKRTYRYITIWQDDQYKDLIFGVYAPLLEIDFAVAQELIENRIEYCCGASVYALMDFTNVKSVSKEARDYMNSVEGGLRGMRGGAFVSNNVVATLFVNLYLRVSSPVVPARFFTNRIEALEWLVRIKNEDAVSIDVTNSVL